MPTPERAGRDRSAAETAVLDVLSRLAAKGAFAAPLDAAHGSAAPFGVFLPGDGYARAVATLAGSAVAHACRRGWLAPYERAGCYRIAAAGIEALRRAKSGASTDAAKSRPRSKPTRKAASRVPAPEHAAQAGPLAWLRQRKDKDGQPLITEPQFAAGERLSTDFWRAQLNPRVTADWSATASARRQRRAAPGAGIDLNDNVVAARTRVHRALATVGPELAGILVDVCCHDIGLETAGRTQGWPQRAAKVVLQLALTRLARHYGLLPPELPPGPPRLRHWGAEDYRPDLDAWRT